VIKIILRATILLLFSFTSISGISDEIYKTIDKDGNIMFSFIAPPNSTILQTVSVKKLIKKISVINDASAQNEKVKALTKKLTEARMQRDKKRKIATENYNKEITQIKKQRLEGLKKLNNDNSVLNTEISERDKLRESISRIIENKNN